MGCTRQPMNQVTRFPLPPSRVFVLTADQKKSGLCDKIGIFLSQFFMLPGARVRTPLTKNASVLWTRLAIKSFLSIQSVTLNAFSFYLSMNRTKTQLKKSKDSPHTDVPSRQYFKTSHLRWLKAVSSTLQDVGDVSLLPLIINWCCNHGIKKLPNQAPMNTLVSFSWHSRLPWQQYDLLKTHLILALNTYI